MREILFRLWIWAVALAHTITVIYGLAAYPPDTITAHMIAHEDYRIALSTCVVIEIVIWFLCVWAKQSSTHTEAAVLALLFLTSVLISWITLSTILTTNTHLFFVGILYGCFLVFTLLLCYLTRQQDALIVLRVCIFLLVVSAIAMLALYTANTFYIPEHIAFFVYVLTFIAFFTVHTYPHWPENDDDLENGVLDEYDCIWDSTWEDPECHNPPGTYYAGRGGPVWIPASAVTGIQSV